MSEPELIAEMRRCLNYYGLNAPYICSVIARSVALIEQLQADLAAEKVKQKLSERLTAKQADLLLERLTEFGARIDSYEYGLPISDDNARADMREIIDEWLKEVER